MKFFYTPKIVRKLTDKLVWELPALKNEVYLTFDDGPNEEITTYILDRLQALNWKATFFCVGENAQKRPHLVQRMLAEGHAIGNHTFRHKNAWKTPFKDYLNSIHQSDKIIQSNLFRPPYGRISRKLIKEIHPTHRIIMWSFMAYDFDLTIPHEKITEKAQKYIHAGSIVVLHDNEKFIENEKAVFELIVAVLHEKGFYSRAIH